MKFILSWCIICIEYNKSTGGVFLEVIGGEMASRRLIGKQQFRIISCVLFCIIASFAWAQESAYLSFSPAASIPLGESSGIYSFGIGAGVSGHFPLGLVGLEATASLEYQGNFLQAGAGYMNLLRAGGGISWPFLRTDFVSLWIWARSGAFLALYRDSSPLIDPWISGGTRIDFAIAKGFLLSLEPSYDLLLAMQSGVLSSFYSGIGVGIRAVIQPSNLGTRTRTPKLRIQPPEFNKVFPVAYKYYDTHPIGSVKLVPRPSSSR
jgi:hypothetical protein